MTGREDAWRVVGINEPGTVIDILFNPASECVVAHMDHDAAGRACTNRLYYRHLPDPLHTPVPAEEDHDHDFAVSSPDQPFVLFVVRQVAGNGGFDWHSVARLDLPAGKVTTLTRKLALPPGYSRGWASKLLGVYPNSMTFAARVGLQSSHSNQVEYWIADIVEPDFTVILRGRLPAVFI